MSRLLIAKVGGSTLESTPGENTLNFERMDFLGQDIGSVAANQDVVLISSGGNRYGWEETYNGWDDAIPAGTKSFHVRREEIFDQSTYDNIFDYVGAGRLAVANVNERTLKEGESWYRSNDNWAAKVALRAIRYGYSREDIQFVILTDRDGIEDANGEVISEVRDFGRLEGIVHDTNNSKAVGGMITKVTAMRIARRAGLEGCIANGRAPDAVTRAMSGDIGTRFPRANVNA